MRRRGDRPSLVAGIALIAFGGVLLADALGAISLTFAVLAPLVCALLGAILVAFGLDRDH